MRQRTGGDDRNPRPDRLAWRSLGFRIGDGRRNRRADDPIKAHAQTWGNAKRQSMSLGRLCPEGRDSKIRGEVKDRAFVSSMKDQQPCLAHALRRAFFCSAALIARGVVLTPDLGAPAVEQDRLRRCLGLLGQERIQHGVLEFRENVGCMLKVVAWPAGDDFVSHLISDLDAEACLLASDISRCFSRGDLKAAPAEENTFPLPARAPLEKVHRGAWSADGLIGRVCFLGQSQR
jgi:hypothetical protein